MKQYFIKALYFLFFILASNLAKATIYYTLSATTYSNTNGGSPVAAPDYVNDTIFYYHSVTLSSAITFTNCDLTIKAGKTLTLQGGADYNFNNSNVLVESSGTLRLNNAKLYYNSGTATINGNFNNASNSDQFINAGTFSVATNFSTGNTFVLTNSGTLSFGGTFTKGHQGNITNSGTLTIAGTTSISNSTTLNNSAGATINFNGNFTNTAQMPINNSGTINFNGTATFSNTVTIDNDGAASSIVFASTLNSSTQLTITNDGNLSIAGAASFSNTFTLTNTSTAAFSAASSFTNSSQSFITNSGDISLGSMTLSNTLQLTNNAGSSFDVAGAYVNSSQTTVTNSGEISMGSVAVQNNFNVTNNSTADFTVTGNFTNSSQTSFNNSGNVSLNNVAVQNNFNVTNSSGGDFVVAGNFSNTSQTTLTNSGDMEFNAMTLSNNLNVTNNNGGTADFNGNISNSSQSTFNNSGELNLNGNYTSGNNFNMTNQSTGVLGVNGTLNLGYTNFSNAGELNGSGTINYSSGSFSNSGTINGASSVSVSNPLILPAYPQNGNTASWTTYNGSSYSSGSPSCSVNLNVTGNLTVSSNLSAKRLVVGRGVTLTVNSGRTLEVCDNVVNDGTIIIQDGGSLLESGSTDNSGSGTYIITRTSLTGANTVNFMSSPITACSTSVLNSNPCDIYMWDPIIQYFSFDYPSGYVGNCNGVSVTFSGVYSQADGDYIMNPCRGYGVKTGSSTTKTFTGTANNGTLNYTIYSSGLNNASGWSGDDWNLVGNPYPSALNLTTFLTTNSSFITGGAYLWDDDGTSGTGYTSSDYFVYNGSGSSTSPNSGKSFDGKLNTGVAFWVQANDVDAPGGDSYSLVFNNSMRVSGSNNDDFKQTEASNRIWLELRKDTNFLSSNLVAFIEGASDNLDNLYDSKRENAGNPFFINSMLGNTALVIQGMAPIRNFRSKLIPLQVVTPAADTYRIYCGGLEKSDEKFMYYLIDEELHTTTLLNSGVYYEFTQLTAGTINNRFYLKAVNAGPELTAQDGSIRQEVGAPQTTDTTTSTVEIEALKTTTVYCYGATLNFSSEQTVQSVELIDITGRTVANYRPAAAFGSIPLALSNGIYSVRYTTIDGNMGTEKIMVTQ